MTTILTIIVFIIMLGILVFVHELGHFSAARLSGITVKEFAFGFPPRLWGKKIKGTLYAINLFPIGGYVKMLGEDESSKDEGAFCNKSVTKRIFVVVAGVLMNFILAYFAFLILFWCSIPPLTQAPEVYGGVYEKTNNSGLVVDDVLTGGLAEKNDVKKGDIILKINNISNPSVNELKSEIGKNKNSSIDLEIKKTNGENISKKIEIGDNSAIGVSLTEQLGKVRYTWWKVPYYAAVETVRAIGMTFEGFYNLLKSLFVSHKVPAEVSGPIGIFGITATAVQMGFEYVLVLFILLTINLGVINILPFPALDGGRLVFLIVEKIRGKKVAENVEGVIHGVGFILLIGLIILVTIRDIIKL